jgi:hypothetical protein
MGAQPDRVDASPALRAPISTLATAGCVSG